VGDVDRVDTSLLTALLLLNKALVFAPITHNGKGQLLNTNADTIAGEIARGLSGSFETTLVYSFEKSGVLLDADDESTLIRSIHPAYYRELKERQIIFSGMIPKLDNAFAALDSGVARVIIGRAEELPQLLSGRSGTTIVHE
jgi:acetylglutamate kinase